MENWYANVTEKINENGCEVRDTDLKLQKCLTLLFYSILFTTYTNYVEGKHKKKLEKCDKGPSVQKRKSCGDFFGQWNWLINFVCV